MENYRGRRSPKFFNFQGLYLTGRVRSIRYAGAAVKKRVGSDLLRAHLFASLIKVLVRADRRRRRQSPLKVSLSAFEGTSLSGERLAV